MRRALAALMFPAALLAQPSIQAPDQTPSQTAEKPQAPDKTAIAAKVGRAKVVGDTQIVSVWFAPPLLSSFAQLGGATDAQVEEAKDQFAALKGYQLFMVRVVGIDAQLQSHEWELAKLQETVRLKAGSAVLAPFKEIPQPVRVLMVAIKKGMAAKERDDMHFQLLLFPEVDAHGKRVLDPDQKGRFEMLVPLEGQPVPVSLEWETPVLP